MPIPQLEVSVLVPCYNSAAFIADCLRSITSQTRAPDQILVIDDGSTDGTYEIVLEQAGRDDRITVLRNDPNAGSRENFRRCLEQARHPWIKFVCGDDLLREDHLAQMTAAAGADAGITLVTSRRLMIDASGQVLHDMTPMSFDARISVLDGTAAGELVLSSGVNWIGEPTTVMFRADRLPVEGLYTLGSRDPARNLDVVWWLKIMAGARIAFVNEPLSMFRTHGGQQSQQPELQLDLVLAWYDIIVGARDLGYLADPAAEGQALAWLVELINTRLESFGPAAWPRVSAVLAQIDARLRVLSSHMSSRLPLVVR